MKYGNEETIKITDPNGSTMTTSVNYFDGGITGPVRTRFSIRLPVKNQREEHEAYLVFSDEIKNNKGYLDPAWKIEHTKFGDDNGIYYVIKCYTILQYQ